MGGGEGFVDAAEVVEAEGENVMRIGAICVEGEGAAGVGEAVLGAGEVAKEPGAVGPAMGPIWAEFEELVEGGEGVGVAVFIDKFDGQGVQLIGIGIGGTRVAPDGPDVSIGGFDVAGEFFCVHHGG